VRWRQRDADAGVDEDPVALELDRLDQAGPQPLREQHRIGFVDGFAQHRELVPAQTSHRVPRADGLLEAVADLHQQEVAGVMPQGVVDRLELVQVEEDHRHRALGRAVLPGQSHVQAVAEQGTVRQVGEDVVQGAPTQLLLGSALLGDVRDHYQRRHLAGLRQRQRCRGDRQPALGAVGVPVGHLVRLRAQLGTVPQPPGKVRGDVRLEECQHARPVGVFE
jgi:hypothetical protein